MSSFDRKEEAEPDDFYNIVYQYDTLEAAYEVAFLFLSNIPSSYDEWLINIQNHLIWRSYIPGEDADTDVVVLSAIDIVLKRFSIRPADAGSDIQSIIEALTLV